MSVIVLCGFEIGDASEIENATGAIESTEVRTGNYSWAGGLCRFIHASNASVTWRWYNKGPLTNSAAQQFFVAYDSGLATLVTISLNANDTISITAGGTGTSTETMTADVWQRMEVNLQAGSGSNGVIHVKVDGVTFVNDTAATFTANLDYGQVNPAGSSGVLDYVDDVIAVDTNDFPGAGRIEALRPNALTAGEDDFTIVGGDTNKWEAVDDDPLDDDTYLELTSTPAGDQELNLTTIASVGTINATKSAWRGNRSGGGATTMRLHSQDSDEIPQNALASAFLQGTFSYFELLDFAPPANQTELDRWQVKLSKLSGGRDMDVSEVWIMVDHTPAAAAVSLVVPSRMSPAILGR